MSTTSPDLATQVAQLQQQVQDLADQLATALPDTPQPNYLTTNPDGTVSADFTGKIYASGGVQIDAFTEPNASIAQINKLAWVRQPDGALIAWLAGIGPEDPYQQGTLTTEALDLQVSGLQTDPGFDDAVELNLTAQAASGALAELSLANDMYPTPGIRVSAYTPTGGRKDRKLLDATGASDYLQAANNLSDLPSRNTARGELGFFFGNTTLTWPGGTPVATAKTGIAHGAPSVPWIVCGIHQDGPWAVGGPYGITAATFNLAIRTGDGSSPAAGTAVTVSWCAIG